MRATDTATITLTETALLLRLYLGPLRNWTNFLTDNIRGKQCIAGRNLMPCARQHDGMLFRPIYAMQDIRDFIGAVQLAMPEARKTPVKATVLTIDRGRHWRINKFDRKGAPVAFLRTITTAGHGSSSTLPR